VLIVALGLSSKVEGTIPSEIGNCSSLLQLNLHTNSRLTGTIPSELGKLSKLEGLRFQSTELSGTMPNEICQLRNLRLKALEADCNDNSKVQKQVAVHSVSDTSVYHEL
jgi:hypothetical protein